MCDFQHWLGCSYGNVHTRVFFSFVNQRAGRGLVHETRIFFTQTAYSAVVATQRLILGSMVVLHTYVGMVGKQNGSTYIGLMYVRNCTRKSFLACCLVISVWHAHVYMHTMSFVFTACIQRYQ